MRGWRDVRYRVVKLGVWNKTSEVGESPHGGQFWFCLKRGDEERLKLHQSGPQKFTTGLKTSRREEERQWKCRHGPEAGVGS